MNLFPPCPCPLNFKSYLINYKYIHTISFTYIHCLIISQPLSCPVTSSRCIYRIDRINIEAHMQWFSISFQVFQCHFHYLPQPVSHNMIRCKIFNFKIIKMILFICLQISYIYIADILRLNYRSLHPFKILACHVL